MQNKKNLLGRKGENMAIFFFFFASTSFEILPVLYTNQEHICLVNLHLIRL